MNVNELTVTPSAPARNNTVTTTNNSQPQADTAARQVFANNGNTLPPAEASNRQESTESNRDQMVEALTRQMQSMSRQLNFSINKDVERTVVKVLDASTGEVVRQIPSEEFINLAQNLRIATEEAMKGIFLDNQV
jgi:flagellar protein FlaG